MPTDFLVEIISTYIAIGGVFGAGFALRGAAVVDPAARHGSAGFRLLLVPGAALLWPVLALRWWRADSGTVGVPGDRTDRWQGPAERLRSRALLMWIVLAPLITLVLWTAIRAKSERLPESRDAGRLPASAVRSPRP